MSAGEPTLNLFAEVVIWTVFFGVEHRVQDERPYVDKVQTSIRIIRGVEEETCAPCGS